MRLALIPVFAVAVACGNTSSNGPCTLTAIGAQCISDTDCCSGYCDLEGTAAYCQAKPQEFPACIDADGFCTQNRNCCSGLCKSGSCFGGTQVTSCLSVGSTCLQNDSCCTDNCIGDGQGHTLCATQPVSDAAACGLPGVSCSNPGASDPAECCFGVCDLTSLCGGGTTGGGQNCGQAGSFCTYGSDCCSSVCQQSTSGSSCQ